MTKEIKQLYIFILARKGLVWQRFNRRHSKQFSRINILLEYDTPISFVVGNDCIKYYKMEGY